MNALVEYWDRETAIHPYIRYEDRGGIVDDILRRLDKVETGVSELKADVSELKSDVRAILATIPHLATKSDVAEVKTLIANVRTELKDGIGGLRTELKDGVGGLRTELKDEISGLRTGLKDEISGLRTGLASMESKLMNWFIATALAVAGAAFSFAKFVH